MSDGGNDEDSAPVLPTQASSLAGISHGVETQILKNMFNSLPPSSQIVESEMLGPSDSYVRIRSTSHYPADLETQRQSPPREESIESFADKSMEIASRVIDRGLDCFCEVEVWLQFCTSTILNSQLSARRYRHLLV
jgi:hypothetical protein